MVGRAIYPADQLGIAGQFRGLGGNPEKATVAAGGFPLHTLTWQTADFIVLRENCPGSYLLMGSVVDTAEQGSGTVEVPRLVMVAPGVTTCPEYLV